MGRKVDLRPGWDGMRVSVMKYIVTAKFNQHADLMAKLCAIDGNIVEGNTWGDTFWGQVNGSGQNYLGRILMEIRKENT